MSLKSAVQAPKIGPYSAGMLMTPEEFDQIPPSRWEKHYRYEVINGVLVVSPPVADAEADPNDDLGPLLRTYQETHPHGRILDSTMPARTVPGTPNRRRCDRAVWVGLGLQPDTEKDVPAIVVEFVSGSRRDAQRDYEAKRDEYLAAGVREYWVIDRFKRIMTIHRHAARQVVTERETYQTDLLPGFRLPLARLLANADKWPRRRRGKTPAKGAQ
jgi:Uma2 family endonuclease